MKTSSLEELNKPSIILEKLKDVDGLGSGLDADLLNGINSSGFNVTKSGKILASGSSSKSIEIEIKLLNINEMYEVVIDGYDYGNRNAFNTKIFFYDYTTTTSPSITGTRFITTSTDILLARVYKGANGNFFVRLEFSNQYYQLVNFSVFRNRFKEGSADTVNDIITFDQALPDVRDFEVILTKDLIWTDDSAEKSLDASGYQKLPSGLIIQWGTFAEGSLTTGTITFPIAFPTALLSMNYDEIDTGSDGGVNISTAVTYPTSGGVSSIDWGASAIPNTVYYIAIGY